MGRDDALKLLSPELREDSVFRKRFLRECKVTASLEHPNVVPVYDTGEFEGLLYIAMRYVPGPDLRTVLEKGPLEASRAVAILTQVAAALDAARQAGLVHRDVKPHNIMLTPQSQVKIMDFGIVRDMDRGSVTQTGLVMGTPDYMSPEQAQGRDDVDQRSDVYSLGVVLYEMFTGVLPFKGDTPISIAMKHVTEHPRPPRAVNPSLPEEMERIILRCMKKSPAERYQNMADVLADLYRISAAARPRVA